MTLARIALALAVSLTTAAASAEEPGASQLMPFEEGGAGMLGRTVPFAGGRLGLYDRDPDEPGYDVVALWETSPGEEPLTSVLARAATEDESFRVRLRRVAKDVVQVSIEQPLDLQGYRMIIREEHLFVATRGAEPRHFRIVTGIQLGEHIDEGLLEPGQTAPPWRPSGWARSVRVDAMGVRIRERDGPLALFRQSGRFTWDELAAAIPRWRRQGAALIAAAARLEPKALVQEGAQDEPYPVLRLIEGFIEPLDGDYLDDVGPMRAP